MDSSNKLDNVYFGNDNAKEFPRAIDTILSKIRYHVLIRRVRILNFFEDFDKLRAGYVSEAIFKRCIDMILATTATCKLSSEEYNEIAKYYYDSERKMVNWRSFVDDVDSVFGTTKPYKPTPLPRKLFQHILHITDEEREQLEEVINIIKVYCNYHNSNVNLWCKDYDFHNSGYVSRFQFLRAFPQNLLSKDQLNLLIKSYTDPLVGHINYSKINNDVNIISSKQFIKQSFPVIPHNQMDKVPDGTEFVLKCVPKYIPARNETVLEIEDKIKKQIYVNRINLYSFFCDYDSLNHGIINPEQFYAGISLARINISDDEVKRVADAYTNAQGKIYYKLFCKNINTIFTVHNLEYYPTCDVKQPSYDYLVKTTNKLSPEKEERLKKVISFIKHEIDIRGLIIRPYFTDFDAFRCTSRTGKVMRSQFHRILSTMKIDLSQDDLYLLYEKYQDPETGLIKYMSFIDEVEFPKWNESEIRLTPRTPLPYDSYSANSISRCVIDKLKDKLKESSLNISNLFIAHDPNRSGEISRKQFIEVIEKLGITLTSAEANAITNRYSLYTDFGKCNWKLFIDDLEDHSVNISSLFSKDRTSHYLYNNDDLLEGMSQDAIDSCALKEFINRMYEVYKQDPKLFEQTFDELDGKREGVLDQNEMRHAFSSLGINLSNDDWTLLSKYYFREEEYLNNNLQKPLVFSYLVFLKDVKEVPTEIHEDFHKYRTNEKNRELYSMILRIINIYCKENGVNLKAIFQKKDPQDCGYIRKDLLHNIISSLNLNLSKYDTNIILEQNVERYNTGKFNYENFINEINSAFLDESINDKIVTDNKPRKYLSIYKPTFKNKEKCEKVIKEIASNTKCNILDIFKILKSNDIYSSGKITFEKFKEALIYICSFGKDNKNDIKNDVTNYLSVLMDNFNVNPVKDIDYYSFYFKLYNTMSSIKK
ncbi:hypothetical protein H8356DRAFT_1668791 [Neocallimastix lanati (nom. inval.)]|jgi:Ca2+-binding EF-hand superfamily protein|uniref:EF-hand domain-containing protein n=1 Tax=Neocallimastix californiae TaxID=1754190 RepID=A0A1Y2EVD2_9FUNG|nr:hypothetical protein H8356DRAFT_1668791 [Neocallimastix sp. JGI-2020a]ORY75520.1 hypothetical protein LY90DRAFT_698965 [Neocallimastix californiae]|eukprot:ORY75520.1 hypothetical protein LY90DRAFT_698965 [Neocallimastix californiae]